VYYIRDSSNTAHLLEMVEMNGKVGYHIEAADNIKEDGSIVHRDHHGNVVTTKNFLKTGKLTIGLTSGASTPDRYMQVTLNPQP
jgi:4-hydroxy-3-methylbut-2-enyl diphosphate reductase